MTVRRQWERLPRYPMLLVASAVVVLLGIGAAIAAVSSDGPARVAASGRAAVTTTAEGVIIARQPDRRRGLVFTVASSPALGSGVYITLTPNAPRSTRAAVLHRPLAGTCEVPGAHVGEFPGHWDPHVRRHGTALMTDDSELVVARLTTSCALYVGDPGATPGTAVFPRRPFSRVRMR